MPEEIIPAKIQQVAKAGFERMKNYRRATAMFVKEYAGYYYRQSKGLTGEEPINLIFNTIRAMVPNLVMQSPINQVTTKFTAYKQYAELLSLALNSVEEDIKLKQTLRAWIVSALFGWGIMKIGLNATGEMIKFGDVNVDPGQVYAELVDLDNFILDPICTNIYEASMLGHKTMVPRQMLLDDNSYNHDLVRRLPTSAMIRKDDTVSQLTQKHMGTLEIQSLMDYVDVCELWIPEANAIVTIPDPEQATFEDYLKIADYYGPKEGPYVFLSFTPPVMGNPLPVASVSLWYDLHRMANRVFIKIMDQADRQKDLLLFNPAAADDAQSIIDAKDGDAIASSDPKGAQVYSFGGQNRGNEIYLQELQVWYNYMSGNPDQMSGNIPNVAKGKETATRSQILQANANISIEDARGILYDQTAEISRRIAWYLHHDPLIEIPLTKRTTGGEEVQRVLTPEQRQGDFLKYTFKIVQRSMSRLDPTIRSKRIMEFGTNILPAAVNAAMMMMQIGMPFNLQRYLTRIAEEMGIGDWVQDMFDDPEFQQKLQLYMAIGPKNAGPSIGGGGGGGMQPNQPFPMARPIATPGQEANQFAQGGAAESQAANQGVY